jgi:pimeloyl-ACP methyl ester carboxylesterase
MTETFRVGLNAFEIVDNGQTVNLNSKVKAKIPTIIITHGWNNDLTAAEFRNLLKAVKYNTSVQVLVVDWSQASKTGAQLGLAASRIEVSASKVVDLIQKYQLDPNNISLIGHSLGAHLSVDVALELQRQSLGNVKSITLLDPAVDVGAGGYKVKDLSKISQSTFIRAFYTSAAGSSSFAASANESYKIQFPSARDFISAHGESMTLLANSFQGDSNGKRNCISEQFIKLSEKFAGIPQNEDRKRGWSGISKPSLDLNVSYDSNRWLYPIQISKNNLPMVAPVSDPKTGVKCLVFNGSELNILK